MKKSDSAVRAIRAAKNETQVIAAVRDYLAALDAGEIALIPIDLMASGLEQAEEIVQSALQLVHGAMGAAHSKAAATVLNEATLVLSEAAKRLAALATDEV
jgi:hypothetical protein